MRPEWPATERIDVGLWFAISVDAELSVAHVPAPLARPVELP
jgi:hypothetical protein